MTIEIIDRNGIPVSGWTWGTVQADFGLSLTRAEPPAGAVVYRLVKLVYDDSPNTDWRLYVIDEYGVPLPGVAGLMGIYPPSGTDLPPDAAPRITEEFWGQPEDRPNRAEVLDPNSLNFTNLDGYVIHCLGAGSNYIPPGPGTHWAWIMGQYSDVPAGFGMWDEHKMFWPVFQRQTVEEEPGEPEEPEALDLSPLTEAIDRATAQLERIAEALERSRTITVS